MAKNKRKKAEEAEAQDVTIDDFIIPQKISAFVEAYEPCPEALATETFDEARLRNFFSAWPECIGDPLGAYLARLEDNGFRLKIGRTGEPAIFAIERNIENITL